MRIRNWFAIPILALLPVGLSGQNQQGAVVISVDAANPGAKISSSMYGIFFEDINFGADGGLYPELVKNRSFEFSEPLAAWHEIMVVNGKGFDVSKGELLVRTDDSGYGLYNVGFRGMGVKEGAEYRFSAYVRTNGPIAIRASLVNGAGAEI